MKALSALLLTVGFILCGYGLVAVVEQIAKRVDRWRLRRALRDEKARQNECDCSCGVGEPSEMIVTFSGVDCVPCDTLTLSDGTTETHWINGELIHRRELPPPQLCSEKVAEMYSRACREIDRRNRN